MAVDGIAARLVITGTVGGQYVASVQDIEFNADSYDSFYDGDPLTLDYFWKYDTFLALAQELAADVGAFKPAWLAMLSEDYRMDTLSVTPVGISESSLLQYPLKGGNAITIVGSAIGTNRNGEIDEPAVDFQSSGPVAFLTIHPKRVGKLFVPAVPATHCINGILSSEYIDLISTFATTFVDPGFLLAEGDVTMSRIVIENRPKIANVKQFRTLTTIIPRIGTYVWSQNKRRVPL